MSEPCNYLEDQGVSEALGFMIIFGLVVTGIGLVTLYGYPMLLQQQTSADEQIMEKNMIVLQNDVKMVTYKTIPFKETSLKIGSGSLTSYSPTYDPLNTPSVEIYNTSLPSPRMVEDYIPGDLRYESDSTQTDISLQNGAVVMKKRIEAGSVMLAEPRWYYDSLTNTMVIPLITLSNTDTKARTGIGTVQMKMVKPVEMSTFQIPGGDHIYVQYDPMLATQPQDYSTAWGNYLTTRLGATEVACIEGSPSAKCYKLGTRDGPTLVIKKFDIMIESL
jgi:hypothetical protein